MADNVPITAGSGTNIATDDVGGVHFQKVKLDLGGDGASSPVATSLPVNDAGGALTVDGTVAVSSITAGDNNIGNVDIVTVPAPLSTAGGGTEATAQRVTIANDSTGVLSVDDNGGSLTVDGPLTDTQLRATAVPVSVASVPSHAVTNAGTFATQATLAAETTKVIGTVNISASQTVIAVGPTAHDAALTANPQTVGAKAVNAEQTAVANNDVTNFVADLTGKQIVLPYANPENFISGTTAAITDTTRTAVIAAAGSGVRNFITQITITNSHATVGTLVTIEDGTTAVYRVYAAPVGGGAAITLPVPLKGTANTAINASCATTGSNVYVCASGYKGV